MAYSADTFVADEQPTTAKWNKLWTNDASFNDGSGLNNISNPIVAAAASHLVLTPGTNKFVKTAVLRQDDTSNSYKNNSVFLTGWGVITGTSGTVSYTETVTMGITFDQRPIVVGINGGDALTATGSAYGSGGNVIAGDWYTKVFSITTSAFQIKMSTSGFSANGFVFYQWMATGELA